MNANPEIFGSGRLDLEATLWRKRFPTKTEIHFGQCQCPPQRQKVWDLDEHLRIHKGTSDPGKSPEHGGHERPKHIQSPLLAKEHGYWQSGRSWKIYWRKL